AHSCARHVVVVLGNPGVRVHSEPLPGDSLLRQRRVSRLYRQYRRHLQSGLPLQQNPSPRDVEESDCYAIRERRSAIRCIVVHSAQHDLFLGYRPARFRSAWLRLPGSCLPAALPYNPFLPRSHCV
ncbi:unnamed protein product, partial [Closterium sp. NIES-53]